MTLVARAEKYLKCRLLHARDDAGYVAMLAVIMVPLFIGILAFAVDVGHWRLVAARAQKAADAAALAGAVYLPQDMTSATTVAQDIVGRNALPPGSTIVVSSGATPTQLKVAVTTSVPNITGAIFGSPTTSITREAVAEYAGPVAMGSRCNLFGDEPPGIPVLNLPFKSSLCASTTGGFWANVAGPQSVKENGDAHQATICRTGNDGCVGGINGDYNLEGYSYIVHVSATLPRMQIQAFDPAFVSVGDHCTSNLAGVTPPLVGPNIYVSGDGPYCTGDQLFTGSSGDGQPVTTSYVVRAPANNSVDINGGTPVAGCTQQYPGFNGPLATPLRAQTYPWSVFRKWVTLCDIANPVPGDYVVQVRTNVPLGMDPATHIGSPTMAGGGHNRFSIRAGMAGDDATNTKISVYGAATMAIYANVPGVKTEFFLARLKSGSAGKVLNLQLFDIGDASAPGKITILAPPASGVTFSGCTGVGPAAGALPSCSMTASSAFNGKWEAVRIPIPAGYKCVDTDPTDCWVRIQYDYGVGTVVQDTTTWSASVEGNPVRLLR